MRVDMDAESGKSQDDQLVTKAIEQLGEHFDTIQIFATRYTGGEKGGTVHVCKGDGNWYARYGQVVEWINREEESARIEMRNDREDG